MRLIEYVAAGALALLPFAPFARDDGPARRPPLEHVAVVGASMSAGLRSGTDFARVFQASLAAPDKKRVDQYSKRFFFSAPLESGKTQIDAALKGEPTLVLAVDFLFWFGYGYGDGSGELFKSEKQRLELLEQGLVLLERVRCPLVVGDFPDMSASVGRMLLATQVPKPETLKALNARVREWAAKRENVVVVPLGAMVDDLNAKQEIQVGQKRWTPEQTAHWMQDDRLHPTDEGLVAVAALVADALERAELGIKPADFEADPSKILLRVREARAAAPAKKR